MPGDAAHPRTTLLPLRRQRTRLPGPLAAAAGARLRSHGLRGDGRARELHGRPGARQLVGGACLRTDAVTAPDVRTGGNRHRDVRVRHPVSPFCAHSGLRGPTDMAAGCGPCADLCAFRRFVQPPGRRDDADGYDAPVGAQSRVGSAGHADDYRPGGSPCSTRSTPPVPWLECS